MNRPCEAPGCPLDASHVSGVGNERATFQYLCADHTNERVLASESLIRLVWFRSLDAPRLSTRERREARAERLRGWAEKREAKSVAASERAHDLASVIPFGQPVLAGHYSQGRDERYRAKIGRTMDRAVEDGRKADQMRSRAANIEAAAAGSIYSDDVDAVERLEERIAVLEAERDRIKAYNASCRRGARDLSILTEEERAHLLRVAEVGAHLGKNGAYPGYHLTNLSANIKRNRDRLSGLRVESGNVQ